MFHTSPASSDVAWEMCLIVLLCETAEGAGSQQAGPSAEAGDADYASDDSGADDEATLEEEEALAAGDAADRQVLLFPRARGQAERSRASFCSSQSMQ